MTDPLLFGFVPNLGNHLVLVWFCFDSIEPKNHLSKNLQIFFQNFYRFFPKKKKIYKFHKNYKNTFNQMIVKIPQNFVFENNNNIISCHFDNISYFEIFKRLALGSVKKSQFG